MRLALAPASDARRGAAGALKLVRLTVAAAGSLQVGPSQGPRWGDELLVVPECFDWL